MVNMERHLGGWGQDRACAYVHGGQGRVGNRNQVTRVVQKVWQLVTVAAEVGKCRALALLLSRLDQLGAVSCHLRESSGAANSSPSGSHGLPAVSGSAVSTQVTATSQPLASATVATSQPLASSTVVGSSGMLFGSLRHGIEHVGWGYVPMAKSLGAGLDRKRPPMLSLRIVVSERFLYFAWLWRQPLAGWV